MPHTLAARLALPLALGAAACSSTAPAPSAGVHAGSAAAWIVPPTPPPRTRSARPAAWSAFALNGQEHGGAGADEDRGHGDAELALDASHASADTGEHDAEHEHAGRGTHVLDLFLGGVDEIRDRSGQTIGLDYGYYLAEHWGVGAFGELITGTRRSFAGGLMAFYHPLEPWFIGTGPGFERYEDEWEPIWRIATAWEIHVRDGLFLAPTLAYDWNEENGFLVYGLSFGIVR